MHHSVLHGAGGTRIIPQKRRGAGPWRCPFSPEQADPPKRPPARCGLSANPGRSRPEFRDLQVCVEVALLQTKTENRPSSYIASGSRLFPAIWGGVANTGCAGRCAGLPARVRCTAGKRRAGSVFPTAWRLLVSSHRGCGYRLPRIRAVDRDLAEEKRGDRTDQECDRDGVFHGFLLPGPAPTETGLGWNKV